MHIWGPTCSRSTSPDPTCCCHLQNATPPVAITSSPRGNGAGAAAASALAALLMLLALLL
jgi:hypothetical protein